MTTAASRLGVLCGTVIGCARCPRLVAWRTQVATVRRRAYRDETYWGRPVPGWGDPGASLVIVGMAPGAHGANRTGRVFTGDASGDFLYPALHRAGYGSQPASTGREDGLTLADCWITSAVRCVPPGNLPTPAERAACAGFLDRELALLTRARVVLCLGAVAWNAVWRAVGGAGHPVPRPRPGFSHGAEVAAGPLVILGSYHVSQQNTRTGRLTAAMLDAVLARARALAVTSPAC